MNVLATGVYSSYVLEAQELALLFAAFFLRVHPAPLSALFASGFPGATVIDE